MKSREDAPTQADKLGKQFHWRATYTKTRLTDSVFCATMWKCKIPIKSMQVSYYPPQQKMLKYKKLRSSLGYKVEAQNAALVLFHAFWSEKLWWGPQCQSSYSLSKLSLVGSCEKIWKLEIHRPASNKKQSRLHLACTKAVAKLNTTQFFCYYRNWK